MSTAPTRERHAALRVLASEGREVEDLHRRPACASGPSLDCGLCGEQLDLQSGWVYCNGFREHLWCHQDECPQKRANSRQCEFPLPPVPIDAGFRGHPPVGDVPVCPIPAGPGVREFATPAANRLSAIFDKEAQS